MSTFGNCQKKNVSVNEFGSTGIWLSLAAAFESEKLVLFND
jgi:hypothetical protein